MSPEIHDIRRVINELAQYKGDQGDAHIDGGRSLERIENLLISVSRERDRYRNLLVAASGAVNLLRALGSESSRRQAEDLHAEICAALEES